MQRRHSKKLHGNVLMSQYSGDFYSWKVLLQGTQQKSKILLILVTSTEQFLVLVFGSKG